MDGLIAIAAILAMLLAAGTIAGLARRRAFSFRWLLVAAALVALNDALLTRGYGLVPDVLAGDWNWQGSWPRWRRRWLLPPCRPSGGPGAA
ncbi:MAG TPA: hypothetical protein VI168_14170 [Croceibacterium sp.]